ncbi:MAG: L,D-transpeptidase family protein [Acidobacteriota bacterium]|nr:L,D-transpeptidase family protein [Acidobacteriota bacterium]
MIRRPPRSLTVALAALAAATVALAPDAGALGRPTASASLSAHVRLQPYSHRLEQQYLAELRYLPLTFTPAATSPTTTTTVPAPTTSAPSSTTSVPVTTTTLASRATLATTLVAGRFIWRFAHLPRELVRQWRLGAPNVIERGALMAFQAVRGLATTGNVDTITWRALQAAVAARRMDPDPYNNVLVSEKLPQSLALFVNGRIVYRSLVNTGISVAPTATGTYPVYLRFVTTTMSGTLPNGQPYHDTGIPWTSYFNGGDALHGFLRSSYGWPQSLGCVEMPFANAKRVWPHTPIGTLVTVI